MMSSAGESVLVQFPDDRRPLLWQERVLLGRIAGSRWIVASPDEELDEIDLAEHDFRALPRSRKLPGGVREADCYLVYFEDKPKNFFTQTELDALIEEGTRMAVMLGGVLPAVPPPRAGDLEARAGLVGDPLESRVPGRQVVPMLRVWTAVEQVGSVRRGDEVPRPSPDLCRGERGLAQLETGEFVLAKLCALSEITLPIVRVAGQRLRERSPSSTRSFVTARSRTSRSRSRSVRAAARRFIGEPPDDVV